jgi:general stress protein 26
MAETRWAPAETKRIAKLLKDIDISMFFTRSDGSVRGRPMSNNGKVEFDGDSWFFSFRDTPKIEEIEADPRVQLAYMATEKGSWISIEGTAEIVDDDERKKKLWEKQLEQWFTEGPEDDDVVLVKVSADRIHAWAEGEEIVAEPGKPAMVIESEEDSESAEKSKGSRGSKGSTGSKASKGSRK